MQSGTVSIISCIISGLLLIVTFVSVICAFKAYHHQRDRAKKEAACRLAQMYADKVIPKYQLIMSVFASTDLVRFIKETFPMDELSSFSYSEMSALAMEAGFQPDEIAEKLESIDPLCIVDVLAMSTPSISERNMLNVEYVEINQADGCRVPRNEHILMSQFRDDIVALLNMLEWFAMNCRYGLADETVIYQSLHQTFLSTIWSLYYHISRHNQKNEDKYYTNIIWLFKEWKARLSEQTESVASERLAAMESMRIAKEQYENAGNGYAGKALK